MNSCSANIVVFADIFDAATKVTTPIALVAFAIAAFLVWRMSRQKHETARLNALPEDERSQQVDELLTRYGIGGSDLTRAQRFELIREEMRKRFKLKTVTLAVLAFVFVLCVYAWTQDGTNDKPGNGDVHTPGPTAEQLRLDLARAKSLFLEKDFVAARDLLKSHLEHRDADDPERKEVIDAKAACEKMIEALAIADKYGRGKEWEDEDADRFSELTSRANDMYPYYDGPDQRIRDPRPTDHPPKGQ